MLNDIRNILHELEHLDAMIFPHGDSVRVIAGPGSLSAELRARIKQLRRELREYLLTEGVEVIDEISNDPEVLAHSGMRSRVRTAAEIEADARKSQAAAAKRRQYQNGTVMVTPVGEPNYFGHFMEQLRRDRDKRAAAERGDAPEPGRYQTRWNIFG
jgi:hypothetical protein